MNRLRLTASALAATSLSSLGLAGFGAPAAHAAPVVPGAGYNGRGFDTCTAPTDAQMDDWYAHSPYHAVGVYIGGPSYVGLGCAQSADPNPVFVNHGGYTDQWVQHQAAAGWAMWALYSGSQAKGLNGATVDATVITQAAQTEGADAVQSMKNLGFAPGTIIFFDMEGYNNAAWTPNVVSYLKQWAAVVQAGGYKAGLYGNSNQAGAASTLGDAAADPALAPMLAAVDIAAWASTPTSADPRITAKMSATFHAGTNDANLPPGMWAQHQRIHQYFGGHDEQWGGTTLNIDSDQLDLAPAVPQQPIQRFAGSTRVGTAVYTSQQMWPNAGPVGSFFSGARPSAQAAVLSRADNFADALGGSALAAHVSGPLLLTGTATLDPQTAGELRRTLAPGSPVYLLGGEKAISPAVATAITNLGFTPVRLGASDRYGTAVAIAQRMAQDMVNDTGQPWVQRVLLATGANFPDALAAGTAAGASPDTVLLLSQDKQMPPATLDYLKQISGNAAGVGPNSATVYPVGGQADAAATTSGLPAANLSLGKLVGADRYQTATLVAQKFFSTAGAPHVIGFATGTNFPDALSGGAAMATLGGPLLLTAPDQVPLATQGYLRGLQGLKSVDTGRVFGGTAAVGDVVVGTLQALLMY